MSADRTTEILNSLSAISRDVGVLRTEVGALRTEVGVLRTEVEVFRTETKARLDSIEGRPGRIEREQRLHGRRLDRVEGLLLTTSADIGELQDRVAMLEDKQQ